MAFKMKYSKNNGGGFPYKSSPNKFIGNFTKGIRKGL